MRYERWVFWANGLFGLICGGYTFFNSPPHDDSTGMVLIMFGTALSVILMELTRYRLAWAVLLAGMLALPAAIFLPALAVVGFAEILDGAPILSWAASFLGLFLAPLAFFLIVGKAAALWSNQKAQQSFRVALGPLCIFALIHLSLVVSDPWLEDSIKFFGTLAASPFAVWLLLETAPRAPWVRWLAVALLLPVTLFFVAIVAGGDMVFELLLFLAPCLLLLGVVTALVTDAVMLRREARAKA